MSAHRLTRYITPRPLPNANKLVAPDELDRARVDARVLTAADQLAANATDHEGRIARRGIPICGNGGLDERRNPHTEYLARLARKERQRLEQPEHWANWTWEPSSTVWHLHDGSC